MTEATNTIDMLDDIQKLMNEIGELWPLLSEQNTVEAEQRKQLLANRRAFQEKYDEIMDGALANGSESLNVVILKLREAAKQSKEAKEDIDAVMDKIKKVNSAIDQSSKALTSLGSILM
jgi:glucose-6-phosphate isomerase